MYLLHERGIETVSREGTEATNGTEDEWEMRGKEAMWGNNFQNIYAFEINKISTKLMKRKDKGKLGRQNGKKKPM